MQLSLPLFVVAYLAASVAAGVHTGGICLKKDDADPRGKSFDGNATRLACEEYRKRNTGDKKFDKCPDCFFHDEPGSSYCDSKDTHIGGEEWLEYCKQFGGIESRVV